MESLVFSRLTYALPVWGPVVHQDSRALLRLNRLHNRAIRITCGLRKSDHISSHRQSIGWLPVSLLIQVSEFSLLIQNIFYNKN